MIDEYGGVRTGVRGLYQQQDWAHEWSLLEKIMVWANPFLEEALPPEVLRACPDDEPVTLADRFLPISPPRPAQHPKFEALRRTFQENPTYGVFDSSGWLTDPLADVRAELGTWIAEHRSDPIPVT